LSSTGRQCDRLKFDFAIFNNDHLLYLIEYDGNQHFEYFYDSNYKGWNNKENFEKTRSNDLLKNKYCFEHSIPLIRIPYDKTYDINDLKIETTHFLITPQNEKDYYLR